MTKTAMKRELRDIKIKLEWLSNCEKSFNHNWRFTCTHYSKRRERLVKAYWALMAMRKV